MAIFCILFFSTEVFASQTKLSAVSNVYKNTVFIAVKSKRNHIVEMSLRSGKKRRLELPTGLNQKEIIWMWSGPSGLTVLAQDFSHEGSSAPVVRVYNKKWSVAKKVSNCISFDTFFKEGKILSFVCESLKRNSEPGYTYRREQVSVGHSFGKKKKVVVPVEKFNGRKYSWALIGTPTMWDKLKLFNLKSKKMIIVTPKDLIKKEIL